MLSKVKKVEKDFVTFDKLVTAVMKVHVLPWGEWVLKKLFSSVKGVKGNLGYWQR